MKEKLEKYVNDINLLQFTYDLFTAQGFTSSQVTNQVIAPYLEDHRYFHTKEHIFYILRQVHRDYFFYSKFSLEELKLLVIATWFHDIVYNPKKQDNEEQSVAVMENFFKQIPLEEEYHDWSEYVTSIVLLELKEDLFKINKLYIIEAIKIILDTKTHKPEEKVSKIFSNYDMSGLFEEELETEFLMFKEYQFYDFELYQKGRIDFLTQVLDEEHDNERQKTILRRINWIKNFSPKIGVYAGSFNPYHIGHENIRQKSEKVFDKVIILFAINPDKANKNFDELSIIKSIQNKLPFIQIDLLPEHSLLTDYLKKKNETTADYTLIKGLRNGDDLSYEENQIFFMKNLYPELKVVFFICDEEFKHISSSAIRSLSKLDKDEAKKYCL